MRAGVSGGTVNTALEQAAFHAWVTLGDLLKYGPSTMARAELMNCYEVLGDALANAREAPCAAPGAAAEGTDPAAQPSEPR